MTCRNNFKKQFDFWYYGHPFQCTINIFSVFHLCFLLNNKIFFLVFALFSDIQLYQWVILLIPKIFGNVFLHLSKSVVIQPIIKYVSQCSNFWYPYSPLVYFMSNSKKILSLPPYQDILYLRSRIQFWLSLHSSSPPVSKKRYQKIS